MIYDSSFVKLATTIIAVKKKVATMENRNWFFTADMIAPVANFFISLSNEKFSDGSCILKKVKNLSILVIIFSLLILI